MSRDRCCATVGLSNCPLERRPERTVDGRKRDGAVHDSHSGMTSSNPLHHRDVAVEDLIDIASSVDVDIAVLQDNQRIVARVRRFQETNHRVVLRRRVAVATGRKVHEGRCANRVEVRRLQDANPESHRRGQFLHRLDNLCANRLVPEVHLPCRDESPAVS